MTGLGSPASTSPTPGARLGCRLRTAVSQLDSLAEPAATALVQLVVRVPAQLTEIDRTAAQQRVDVGDGLGRLIPLRQIPARAQW
ncbi:hypothetical protein GCM10009679_22950 [Saccharothrix algeriensis]|uniref:Uncharacterized protein n=1 Tax=Catellatospora bangladeshensis TaxID=310355 RepID=A0A8J3J8I2_9ACTN|nr:hypothetical protein Cba03nite_06600 [Catellatospora bangladeshensis]